MEKKTENASKKKKKGKPLMIILIVFLALIVVLFFVIFFGLRNYTAKNDAAINAAPGNSAEYDLDTLTTNENSPLYGKNILFLGSSVTYGSAAQATSFADYIGKLDGVNVTKEAVSATTLVDEFSIYAFLMGGDGRSYIERLSKVDADRAFDAVIVQLSTNDASMGKELGAISGSRDRSDFDTKTITGAIEYLIAYAQSTWNCPVVFYTGSYYDSTAYAAMVDRLLELRDKWDIKVINLYTDKEFNDISEEAYQLYMWDPIHPTKAGYLKWWTPYMQEALYEAVGG